MKVLMVGPERRVQGGISGVVNNYYRAGLDRKVDLTYIGTMVDGSKLQKLFKALESYIRFTVLVRKYDIIHVNMAVDASFYRKKYFVCLAKFLKKKVVIHQHGGNVEQFFGKEVGERLLKKRCEVLGKADCLIVLAPIWEDFFQKLLPETKIIVLPNGIELPKVDLGEKDYTNHNIVYIGRICKEKGIGELFSAILNLRNTYSDIHLYLGGKWEDENLREIQEKNESTISYLGWLDEVEKGKILDQCSVFIMPSYFEGQCIAILEGMAHGCASIATRVGGLQQNFENGVSGLLIEPKSVKDIELTIDSLFSNIDKTKDLGARARQYVEKKFDIQIIVNQLVDIYEKI